MDWRGRRVSAAVVGTTGQSRSSRKGRSAKGSTRPYGETDGEGAGSRSATRGDNRPYWVEKQADDCFHSFNEAAWTVEYRALVMLLVVSV